MANGMKNCQTDKRKKRTEILIALRITVSFVAALVCAALIASARPAAAQFTIEQVDPLATTVMYPTHLGLDYIW